MNKTSKKHIRYLVLTLAIMLMLSVGVNLLMSRGNIGNLGSSRSGTFTNTTQSIYSGGWYFFAELANGHSTFFANLDQEELDNLVVESVISQGELILVISQEDVQLTYVLSEAKMEIVRYEIDTRKIEPGRLEMRLYFIYGEDIDVAVSWRD